jgi:hypothetical protein
MSSNTYTVIAATIVINVGTGHEQYLDRLSEIDEAQVSSHEIYRLLDRGLIAYSDNTEAVARAEREEKETNGKAAA